MKRIPLLLLLAALAVSLWFNFRPRPVPVLSSAPAVPEGPALQAPAMKPSPVLPAKLEAIDFSGTGLADESWKLDPTAEGKNIPDQVPDSNASNVPAPFPRRQRLGTWMKPSGWSQPQNIDRSPIRALRLVQASSSLTTFPCTSVRRKSRPA